MNTRTYSLGTLIRSCVIAGWLVLPVCATPPPQANLQDRVATLESQVSTLTAAVQAQAAQIASLQSLLTHFSRVGNEIYITGANVNIRDGTGHTWGQGFPDDPNRLSGLGNLVIGYNESDTGQSHEGSHNVVIGPYHSYPNVGGLVVGYRNEIGGGYSSVSGGEYNLAFTFCGSVSGGANNTASGGGHSQASWVGGGANNTASQNYSSVSGGQNNTADGFYASVSGGENNNARSVWASVSGGRGNRAAGEVTSVSGGENNTANNRWSSVSGGYQRSTAGDFDWAAGGLFQDQ